MTREEAIARVKHQRDWANEVNRTLDVEAFEMAAKALEQELCEDAVSRTEVLKLVRFNAFHVKSQTKAIENMPSVTPQQPKTGYISIDDVMSVFDDFMCGEVDEAGTETFLEMLKDRAESER